ncbi:aspartyl-phosphate phosphatase Spo0E family protein [Metabacillus litoralis]|uniref:aspartyl-phosphate phosphatase Spo0E family protein n=1 Tax=Metabacillus litoralis TaxID=152268 RepID=UPI00255987D6|nr:aspartyl-phosphate phosphatase Spo0E family protein [Metabacillus litoralis]
MLNKLKYLYLKLVINILRSLMINIGRSKGLTHPKTVRYSQSLDIVLNKYSRLKT